MAALSASENVLSNDDLLTAIFAYLNKDIISRVRLVSRVCEAAASPFLFTTLRLGFRKQYIQRLNRVAANEKFAKGVREVVWDTTLGGDSRPTREGGQMVEGLTNLPTSAELFVRFMKQKVEVMRRQRFGTGGADEQITPFNHGAAVNELATPLRFLTGLKSLVITSALSADLSICDSNAVLGPGELVTASHQSGPGFKYTSLLQTHALWTLLKAFSRNGQHLRRLVITAGGTDMLGVAGSGRLLGCPGMVVNWDYIYTAASSMSRIAEPLRHLRELHFSLDDEHLRDKALYKTTKEGGLLRFLGELEELETLSLRMRSAEIVNGTVKMAYIPLSKVFGDTTFYALRKLYLSDYWLEQSELCELLVRHASILEEVMLTNLNLGGTVDASTHYVISADDEHDPFLEWEEVAKTCQKLPKLKGLSIELPSVGVEWEVMGWFEVEKLVETGMDGRPNSLMSRPFAELWEQVEALAD